MAPFDPAARERPVTLSLNEDLVAQARTLTDDLSDAVEQFLVDYGERSGLDRQQRAKDIAEAMDAWNAHGANYGSIADEHSPL